MAIFDDELVASSYEDILFPVVEAGATGGHDSAKHVSLKRRGADIETTGQKPYTFHLKIALVDGLPDGALWDDDLFPGTYRRLIAKFEAMPIGRFSHPTRGPVLVHVDEWTERLAPDNRSGVFLDVTMTEQLATSVIESLGAPTYRDGAEIVVTRATEADAAAPAGTTSLADAAAAFNATLARADATYRQVDGALNVLLAACRGNLSTADLGGIVPADYRTSVELMIAASYDARDAVLGSQKPRTFEVPEDMPVTRIAALPSVYGNPDQAFVLLRANSVPDPTRVPAGTLLVIPPVI